MGSFFNTHHGLTNAVITPYVIVHNRDAIAERMKVVARVLDLPKAGVDGVLDWVLASARNWASRIRWPRSA